MTDPCSTAGHEATAAVAKCDGCRRPFCDNCIVELMGRNLCAECKGRDVRDLQRSSTVTFKEPGEALLWAIVGIFICGIILEPIALAKGISAMNKIKADPQLPGHGTALAAVIISSIFTVVYVIAIILMVSSGSLGR